MAESLLPTRVHQLVGIGILVCSFMGGWLVWDYQVFKQRPLQVADSGVLFEIRPGTSLRQVAQKLEQSGVISSARYFELLGRLSGDTGIRYGEYRLLPQMTVRDLLSQFMDGRVVQYGLTVVEGWTYRQLRDALTREPALKQTLDGVSDTAIMSQLGIEAATPEGLFLPDTYHFPRGLTDLQFLRRSHRAMVDYLEQAWRGRDQDLPYQNSYDALIMASIVEKETGLAEERPAIAGVFVRRLQVGMRLQTDPTVIYGMGDGYDGNIRRRDLERPTPYNTYVIRGLPPTPIALPGAAAIDAALHPAEGDALYFVATGDGGHQFSVTIEEHNRAVDRFQRKRRQ